MNVNQTLLRLVKDVNEIKAALRQVTTNLPLYDIANENTPAAISTDQNNYVPGNYDIIRLSSTTTITITGLAGGVKGRSLKILNIGSNAITLANGSTSSLPANRFRFLSGIDFIVYPDSNIVLYYDISQQRWVEGTTIEDSMISKETTATVSSDQNNYNPTNYGVLRLNATADITITGFAGGVKGRFLEILNVGTGRITYVDGSTSSLPANRFNLPYDDNVTQLPNARARFYYDSTQQRWTLSDAPNIQGEFGRYSLISHSSTTVQTISALTLTTLSPDTVISDEWGYWNNTTKKFVIPSGESGLYSLYVGFNWNTPDTVDWQGYIYIQKNDSLQIGMVNTQYGGTTNNNWGAFYSCFLALEASESVRVLVYTIPQTGTPTRNVTIPATGIPIFVFSKVT